MNESTYRFGDFRLIPAQRELWRSGQLLSVQPKVLDTLIYLIRHRDRAVGRDELISAVWGRPDITDNVLCQIVGRLRQLVGDTGEEQHSVRTVPRFGYRWVGDVDVTPAEGVEVSPAPSVEVTPLLPRSAPAKQWPRWVAAAMTASLLCSLGVLSRASRSGPYADAPIAATTIDGRLVALRAVLKHDRLDQARAIIPTFSDQELARADVRFEAAELAVKEGRYEEARNAYATLQASVDAATPLLAGKIAAGAGWVEFVRGMAHYPEAQQHYEHAIALLQPLKGREAEAALGQVWSRLGGLHTNRLAFDDAAHAYAEARKALESAGDRGALCRLDNNVGLMLTYQYRTADALPTLQRSAEYCAQADDVVGEVAARSNLVNLQLGLLQPAAALASEPRLRVLRDRLGDPVGASHLDLVRARLLIANGRLNDADAVLQALTGRPAASDPDLAAVRNIVAGLLAMDRADWNGAASSIQKALSSEWYSLDNSMATMARWQMIEALHALGDVAGIVKAAADSDAQHRANPDAPDIALYAALARSEAAMAQGDTAKASEAFRQVLAQAEKNRSPYDWLQAYGAYARFLMRQGDMAGAQAVADRLDGWASRDFAASLVQLDVYHALGSGAWSAALARTQRLAGERAIPAALTTVPTATRPADTRVASTR